MKKNVVRTMKGKEIDMTAFVAANANVVALGNARMNARGDIVDRSGNVLKSRDVVVQEYYNTASKTVSQSVSLKSLADEVMTPAEAIQKLEKAAADRLAAATKPKRKIIDIDDTED